MKNLPHKNYTLIFLTLTMIVMMTANDYNNFTPMQHIARSAASIIIVTKCNCCQKEMGHHSPNYISRVGFRFKTLGKFSVANQNSEPLLWSLIGCLTNPLVAGFLLCTLADGIHILCVPRLTLNHDDFLTSEGVIIAHQRSVSTWRSL